MRRRRLMYAASTLLWVATLGGCHHAAFQQRPDLYAELSTVTVEDLLSLASSYARSGDLLRAEQYFIAAHQRGHNDPELVYWLVRVCVAASRYQSALAHAGSYLRDHPSDWSLRLVVATIYEALGYLARAESELERIVAAEPLMPLPHYRLAMLYRDRKSQEQRARAHLEKYLSLSPQGPHAPEARSLLSEAVLGAALGPSRVLSLPAAHVGEERFP